MITSVGIDIVEIERIREMYQNHSDRFIRKLLSKDEQAIFENKANKESFLAGRFACKEAIIKGLGYYLTTRPSFSSLNIVPDEKNMPQIRFDDSIKDKLTGVTCHISISHERSVAIGMAVFSEEK